MGGAFKVRRMQMERDRILRKGSGRRYTVCKSWSKRSIQIRKGFDGNLHHLWSFWDFFMVAGKKSKALIAILGLTFKVELTY